jgi:hypothetical protein
MKTTPAQQAHYQRNRARYIAQAKEQRLECFKFIRSQKEKPCMDCGIQYPYYVMQFDHVRGQKVANIAYLATKNNMTAIRDEIAKCDVVCGNCHAERTWQRSRAPLV